ncbi:MAG TPA: NACHT domain-containing protein, partial [Armatimonadetes bacterium]|nr:NACHT domain-containing protein [Armatimonadota bacterium]
MDMRCELAHEVLERLERLALELRYAQIPYVTIAITDDTALWDWVRQEVTLRVADVHAVREHVLTGDPQDFFTTLHSFGAPDLSPGVLFVWGIEALDEKVRRDLLTSLNWYRGGFLKGFPWLMVLRATRVVARDMARYAPDLMSWCGSGYVFEAPEEWTLQPLPKVVVHVRCEDVHKGMLAQVCKIASEDARDDSEKPRESGKGIVMLFESSYRALERMFELQRRWNDAQIKTRIGIHYDADMIFGDAEALGRAVHIAAQLSEVAGETEIVVSESTRSAVAEECTFAERADVQTADGMHLASFTVTDLKISSHDTLHARDSIMVSRRGREYLERVAREFEVVELRGISAYHGGHILSLTMDEIFVPLAMEVEREPLEHAPAKIIELLERERRGEQLMGEERELLRRWRIIGERYHRLGRLHEREMERVSLDRLIEQERAVVLGDPGSGKTTLLKHIAYKVATGKPIGDARELPDYLRGALPIYIRIGEYQQWMTRSGDGWLDEFITTEWLKKWRMPLDPDDFKRALEMGKCLFLLDGLDEIFTAGERVRVVERIESFARMCEGNRFIVTSRIAG